MGKELDLRKQTKNFALEILKLYSLMPKTTEHQVIGKQFLRSGTSVGAHYREGCRAKSSADMVSKFEGALQELEETQYWLELLFELQESYKQTCTSLINESNELIAILTASVKTIKTGNKK